MITIYQNKWICWSFKLNSHIFWQGGFFLVMVLITSHFLRLSGLPYARFLHLHQTYGVFFLALGARLCRSDRIFFTVLSKLQSVFQEEDTARLYRGGQAQGFYLRTYGDEDLNANKKCVTSKK